MTTLELEIAVMEYFGVRQNIIVPNVSFGMNPNNGRYLHEIDILVLSKSRYATEIELKKDKPDLVKDKEKKHGHKHKDIARFYFAVPEKLKEVALEEIPERAGLLVAKYKSDTIYRERKGYLYERKVVLSEVKTPTRNLTAKPWSDRDILQLTRLGTMRILGLKKKNLELAKQLTKLKNTRS
jgi:hypothetical protein